MFGLGIVEVFVLLGAAAFLLLVFVSMGRGLLSALAVGVSLIVLVGCLVLAAAAVFMVRLNHSVEYFWNGPTHVGLTVSEVAGDKVHVSSEVDVPASTPVEAVETEPTEWTSPTRPGWVDQPLHNDRGVWCTAAKAGPYSTRAEADRALPPAMRESLAGCVDAIVDDETASEKLQLPLAYIERKLAKGRWVQQTQHALGGIEPTTMYTVHVELECDAEAQREIHRMWDRQRVNARLGYTGLGAGTLLVALASLFGYLKLDTMTRGYYTRRLQVAALALVSIVVGLVVSFLYRGV